MTFPAPPETVTVAGREYPIETDFRASVEFELLAGNPDVPPEKAALGMLELYFPQYAGRFSAASGDLQLIYLTEHAEDAICALLDFYSGGMPESPGIRKSRKAKRLYDFSVDEPHIYASFLQAYGIDLRAVRLHWWNFKALFCSLPQDTVFGKILHIRSVDIHEKMSKEEKAEYRRLKRLYALPCNQPQRVQEEEERLTEILMGSGDLSEWEG